jgi:hypothetical protein
MPGVLDLSQRFRIERTTQIDAVDFSVMFLSRPGFDATAASP